MALYGAIKIGQLAFKYRKVIYKVLTAQDRAIGSAYRRGGYGKATQYGVRTGAGIGALSAPFIPNYAPDTPGNGIQKIFQKQPTTRKPYKARNRYPKRADSSIRTYRSNRRYCRQPRYNTSNTS